MHWLVMAEKRCAGQLDMKHKKKCQMEELHSHLRRPIPEMKGLLFQATLAFIPSLPLVWSCTDGEHKEKCYSRKNHLHQQQQQNPANMQWPHHFWVYPAPKFVIIQVNLVSSCISVESGWIFLWWKDNMDSTITVLGTKYSWSAVNSCKNIWAIHIAHHSMCVQ